MRVFVMAVVACLVLTACGHRRQQPVAPLTADQEAEYLPYLAQGESVVRGQAFLVQQGGGVVKAAGRTVTLDPATTAGRAWWYRSGVAGSYYAWVPQPATFNKARRTTTADAEGRFTFAKLPAGIYFARTEVTWEIGGINSRQGGPVGKLIEVKEGENEVVLSNLAK